MKSDRETRGELAIRLGALSWLWVFWGSLLNAIVGSVAGIGAMAAAGCSPESAGHAPSGGAMLVSLVAALIAVFLHSLPSLVLAGILLGGSGAVAGVSRSRLVGVVFGAFATAALLLAVDRSGLALAYGQVAETAPHSRWLVPIAAFSMMLVPLAFRRGRALARRELVERWPPSYSFYTWENPMSQHSCSPTQKTRFAGDYFP